MKNKNRHFSRLNVIMLIFNFSARNLIPMEYVKLESYDGIRTPNRQKYYGLESYTTGLKSNDSSANKNKSRKSSMTKKGKNHYLLNKKNKNHNENQLLKTTTTTKFDSTAVLSCLSTPNSKSL